MSTPKDEMAVLLSEVEIGPYKIKPWSFGRFQQVLPALTKELIPALRGQGITLDNFAEVLSSQGVGIVIAAFPAFRALISATLDITETEIDEMDFDRPLLLGLTIISQNLDRIKNSLPLLMDQIKAMTRGA